MSWKVLDSIDQLNQIKENSFQRTQVIFKHSTRCSISSMAKSRLDKASFPAEADFYYLDLIAFRPVSDAIADLFKVWHESPQVLVIKQGEATYDESHMAINWKELEEVL